MVTKHKSRVNQKYFGCTTELEEAITQAFIKVVESLPNRSKSRFMRMVMWAGLWRVGLATPPESERAEISRLSGVVHDIAAKDLRARGQHNMAVFVEEAARECHSRAAMDLATNTHCVYLVKTDEKPLWRTEVAEGLVRGQCWCSPLMPEWAAKSVERKLKVLGRDNIEDLIAGRLVLYRRADKEWGFALPEALAALGPAKVREAEGRRFGNCEFVHPNGTKCECWKQKGSRFCYAHRNSDGGAAQT
jgi:hypothetical protein